VGPDRGQQQPGALAFVRSAEAKARLLACVSPGNVAKVQQAPGDRHHRHGPGVPPPAAQLFPHVDARAWFEGKPEMIEASAMRNSSLQGGYLILAARALGLDCGPMSGFDAAKVDAAFWAGTAVRTNFVCTLGMATRPR
jgi:3-hydroxypropanoate dehydrogenase